MDASILDAVQNFEHHLVKRENELKMYETEYTQVDGDLVQLKKEQEVVLMKKLILDEASTEARQQAAIAIQEMGTNALQYIMGADYRMKVELKKQAKGDIANIYVLQLDENGELIEVEPSEEDGGGVSDIVAMAIQYALLELTNQIDSENNAPFFMDEPTKYVSAGYSDRATLFIRSMSHSSGRQIIMVTHDKHMAHSGDKVYMVTREKIGRSEVELVGKEEVEQIASMKQLMEEVQ